MLKLWVACPSLVARAEEQSRHWGPQLLLTQETGPGVPTMLWLGQGGGGKGNMNSYFPHLFTKIHQRRVGDLEVLELINLLLMAQASTIALCPNF